VGIGFSKGFSGSGGLSRMIRAYPVLLGLLALLVLIQAVRLIWTVATPLGPVGDWRANQVEVLSPGSRLALFSSFDPFFRSGAAASANVITSLQLTLYGTRMNEGSGLGSAILAGPDGVQDSYAIGDEIMPGVTLESVRFDHVVIDRGGAQESLYLDQSVPAETVDPQYSQETEAVAEPARSQDTGQPGEKIDESQGGEQADLDAKEKSKSDDAP